MKIVKFCFTEIHVKWKKIFASYKSDKEPESRIYKELSNYTAKKIIQFENEQNRLFTTDVIQMASKHKKRCPTLLAIWEMQIKTTEDISTHLTERPNKKE